MAESQHVTQVLLRASKGLPGAVEELFPLVYEELRKVAQNQLRGEREEHTLQATELVHEAYVRLVDITQCQWTDRAHFFAIAGRAMRRILVDHARRRNAGKREGGWTKLPLDQVLDLTSEAADPFLVALGDAVEHLESRQPEKARVVEALFFAGLTQEECAEALGISRRTVARHWEYARAWLHREMTRDAASFPGKPETS